jgi:glycyl-tRNA synthetase beta chain
MVREFPSLQGVMGGLYLKESGAETDLWETVYSHYEPKGFVKVKLEYLGAGLLSIADKIDNITGFISSGIKISSSKDPYGIRRDANAIIKTIIDFKLDFQLDGMIELASEGFTPTDSTDKSCDELIKTVKELFLNRVENIFKDFLEYRYDVVNSIFNTDILNIYRMYLRCYNVSKVTQSDSIEHLIALHKRLKNIIKNSDPFSTSEDLLIETEEKILFDIFKETKIKIKNAIANYDYLLGCSQFLEMKPVIDKFFDKVLVMAEDQKLKENRIALLQRMDELLSEIADFSLIVESK